MACCNVLVESGSPTKSRMFWTGSTEVSFSGLPWFRFWFVSDFLLFQFNRMLIFIMGLEASFRFETHLTFEWTNWTFVIKSLPFEFVQLLQRHMGFFMSYPASVIFHGTSTNCTRNSRFLWFYMNLHDVNPQTLQSWQDLPAFLKTFKKIQKFKIKNHPSHYQKIILHYLTL